jgi:hypothetical protein
LTIHLFGLNLFDTGLGHLAELLLPDWKYGRWLRLLTVDEQVCAASHVAAMLSYSSRLCDWYGANRPLAGARVVECFNGDVGNAAIALQ